MEQLDNTAYNFLEVVSNYTWLIVVAALIIIAILLASGSRPGKEKAKEMIPGVLIGAVLLMGAVSIAKWIVSMIAF